MEHTINSRTIGGSLIYCDWAIDKGYGTSSQIGPWKIALKQVFGTVEGDDFESLDWSDIDVDEYLERFQRIAGANYKTESIVAYGRRVRNALEAHTHYLETGRAPASKPVRRQRSDKTTTTAAAPSGSVTPIKAKQQGETQPRPAMVTLLFPLDGGQMMQITIPPRLKPAEIERVCMFIRTLQDNSPERKQLPAPREEAHEQAA